jgi:hypothetical protein
MPETKAPRPNLKQKRKWATFKYFRPETRMIRKSFRNTKIGIAYRTWNTIKHHLRTKRNTIDKYNLSGVYQLQYGECPHRYVGEMG